MDEPHPPRYCGACGTRLARDNQATYCGPCQKRQGDTLVEVPDVLPVFWEADLMRDALATWHIGKAIQAYRHHPFHGERPLAQERVATWLGLTQAQLSRIENGPAVTDLSRLIAWARTLKIPPHLLWFKLPGGHRCRTSASERPVSVPAGRLSPSLSVGVIAPGDGAADAAAAMQSFRVADQQVGGGHLYASVVNYLQTAIAPRLFDEATDVESRALFTAASALTEMAGWMAHDAGRDQGAHRHFHRSLDLVRVSGDSQLGAHVLASRSHLADHMHRPDEAIRLAREGQEMLRGGMPNVGLHSRLLAMEARGHAALQDGPACGRTLLRAEKALGDFQVEAPSPWVSGFDEGSLASEAARCMRQLGQFGAAQRQAERVIELRPSARARSRAFGQLILATALIAQDKPDEACAIAAEVLDATQSLGSFLVIQQLQDLRTLLEPYRTNDTVGEFLSCLQEAVVERLWLYRWLAQRDPRGAIGGHLEGT